MEDPGITVLAKLRAAMGDTADRPGTCRDCGGSRVIPDTEATESEGPGIWKDCPTCRASGAGGRA